ncbi:hypothetical protein CONPUDRAFT_143750 [Coniophora puteana RWD-64-598 SS2]|uniref:Uncharacterized protein n=1 Tax=Coniophora puteana (strain RWD-64-598) TaxID=741705 RepID=A0A5M3MTF9_CONPW|nr:uncharacterized protein CONPUDRAFT_143750 [Coniophora puteana RWD-64-598 SS2]EIW82327.1 hypothetical protein CONPUDRAFT_143750 [Coniophora puteana RWD-64-598 SS2]
MPTSELSDALNPYFATSRNRPPANAPPPDGQQSVAPNAADCVPQGSGLETIVTESSQSAISQVSPSSDALSPRMPSAASLTAVQELLRYVASTREAQEIERKRRLAWEQEQEAKYALRQAEMERHMLEMRQEITKLRSRLGASGSPAASPSVQPVAGTHTSQVTPQLPTMGQQPTPDTSPALSHHSTPYLSSQNMGRLEAGPSNLNVIYHPTMPQSPILTQPARFINMGPSSPHSQGIPTQRKRLASELSSDEESSTDSKDESYPRQRNKRRNHHDTRCLTIQHAMRLHMLRLMQLENDKALPDSHVEGTTLGPDQPVRFVWDKTTRQSVHNNRMKTLVLRDLKENRDRYKYVPEKDFNKKSLDTTFEQAFVTLRQKYKAQRDESVARTYKQREDTKARSSRRASRKKTKLCNRSDARNRLDAFEHITFDGALQTECMSSEESEVEESPMNSPRSFLRIRGLPWRSTRLRRFFNTLDENDRVENANKPRRGVGRKERFPGPHKDGLPIPPKGVASWMVSKRWISLMRQTQSEVLTILADLIEDPPGFDWSHFDALGQESEDEDIVGMGQYGGMQLALQYDAPSSAVWTL